MTKPLYTVTEYQGGTKHVFTFNPKPGESPYSPELLAVLEAAKRPVEAPATPPAPPPVVPVIPAPTLLAPSMPDARGYGVEDRSLTNTVVSGFVQNVVIQKPGRYVLDNVWSVDSYRDKGMFEGQGLYCAGDNDIRVANSYFGGNGWQNGRPPKGKTAYAHAFYTNTGGSIEIENVVIDRPCCQGIKLMRNSRVKNVFISRAAIGIQAIYGSHLWENVTIYGGGYVWDGSNWTLNTAVSTYCPVTMRDVWAVGVTDPLVPDRTIGKVYNMGVIVGEHWHGQYKDLKGGKVEASGCKVSGWPGKTFAGSRPHDGTGFVIEQKPASRETDAQVERLLSLIRTGKERVTEARVKELQAIARG